VLLPVRDAEATLGEALASVLAQTDGDLEVVVADDGSRDGSLAVARSLEARDARVRVLALERRGIVPALEAARAVASGRYLLRMDADDVSHPERLARTREAIETDPRIAVAACLVESFTTSGGVGLGRRLYDAWLNAQLSHEAMARVRFVESPVAHPSVLLRADAVSRVGGYRDADGPEDWDLWLRLFESGHRFAKVPRTLLRWREGEGRLSRTDARYGRAALVRTRARHLASGPLAGARETIVVGAGKAGRALARELESHGVRPSFFVDVGPRVGRTRRGAPVVALDDLLALRRGEPILGVAAARGARAAIRAALRSLALVEGLDFHMAA
jgi:glycosyltransferase involved in cell wall biosynthesis